MTAVRITRPHAASVRNPLKDPSIVEPPPPELSLEPRPPGSDPPPATILHPGQGVVKGRVSGVLLVYENVTPWHPATAMIERASSSHLVVARKAGIGRSIARLLWAPP